MPSQLTFGAPLWLWGLLALPALAALFVWAERRAARRLVRLIREPRLRAQLTGAASAGRRRVRYGLMLLGLAGLLGAMAEPRMGYETREVHRRGLDLLVVVDVSKSMLATDLAPNRLTRAKLSVQDLVRQLPGDRVGLVAFAGAAFLQAPLTIDYDAVLTAANELDTDLIPLGGTNLGGAIDLALAAFGKAGGGNRAILLLSDGEPTSENEQADGVQAATRAAEAGAKIFTVGYGTPEGAMIPLPGGRRGEFIHDEDGRIVQTKLNEAGLSEIAKAGEGFYLRFTSGEAVMRTIIEDGLSKLRAGDIDTRGERKPIERYQWPLGAGLLFLALAALPGERRRHRAPAGVGGVSAGARAVPVRRTAGAGAAKVAGWWLAGGLILSAGPAGLRAAEVTPPPEVAPVEAPGGPLALYKNGKYDEAYRAFTDLAKENPDQGSLEFDAGASAYMGKKYDEALDAFGKALTSPDVRLRAMSHYNFGNTLFRRGETQKERPAKITDWRNAIQHYNSTLDVLKRGGVPDPGNTLATNTSYNRDLVQQRLDEELKQPPPTPPPQKQDQKKNDKKDKSDQKKQQDKKQDQSKQDQQPDKQQDQDKQQQQQQQQDKQGSSGQSKEQDGSSSSQEKSDGQSNEPPKPDSQQSKPDQNQPPQPSPGGKSDQKDQQNQSGKPDSKDQQNQANGDGQQSDAGPGGTPDPASVPNQDQPRERGDFQSKPEPRQDQPPQGSRGEGAEGTEIAKEEAGKMSPAQANALLNSLRGEDAHVMLNDLPNRSRRDDAPAKDW